MMVNRVQLFAALTVVLALLGSFSRASAEEENELVGLVIGLLADKDKDIRALGLEQVRTSAKGAEATKAFAAQLPKLSGDAKVGLLSALTERGDNAARPDIVATLAASKNEPVRVAAITALGILGSADDTLPLVKLVAAGSKTEQAAARRSLVNLRGETVPSLIASEMKKAAAALRVTLIGILVDRRALKTVPDILPEAVNDDATVRAAAMKALGAIAGPEHIPGMVAGVLKAERGRERESAEKCIMFVCGRIKDANARTAPLLAAIKTLDEPNRLLMLSALGRVGGAEARNIIESAIANSDKRVHELGIRAICNWPSAAIVPRLVELASNDEHPSHRISALRAVIRIAPLRDDRTDVDRLKLLQQAMTMCTRDNERLLVLDRCRAVRLLNTLNFVLPFVDEPKFTEQACYSIVELAHHRTLREPNKKEFHQALDKVIAASKDAVVIDRAHRYKKDQTWVRPK
jgi:HEAT repeat protein